MNLENVQSGDTLIWHGRHIVDSRVVKVSRLTKTQVVIGLDKFRKSDGYLVGRSTWSSSRLMIPKEGEIEKIQEARFRQQLTYKINDACQLNHLRKMSLDTLRQLNSILENQ